MSPGEIVSAIRSGVGLFDMTHRGLIEVRGGDRVRWLDGMISCDIASLERDALGAGCYAVLLTIRGAIVADLHVARFENRYLLESLCSEIPRIRETLERYVVADDVVLEDRSEDFVTLGLEGPASPAVLESATSGEVVRLEAEHWAESTIADRTVLIANFGFSGERGYQIRMQPDDREKVEAALTDAAESGELVRGSREALEILRVEAGLPALCAELDEEVLPPEARLERAISVTKGCYVGQEIVARLRAHGQVQHLLVGLRLVPNPASSSIPVVGAELVVEGRVTGELTSVAVSPTEGPIALGYVRREHAETGTEIEIGENRARVAGLPFVAGLAAVESRSSGAT